MTFSTNPHTLGEISIIPMMVNQTFWMTVSANFALFISWIVSFVLYFEEILPVLTNTVFSHVISLAFPIMFSIFGNHLHIVFVMASLTNRMPSIRFLFVPMKLGDSELLFAPKTNLVRSSLNSVSCFLGFEFPGTFLRTAGTFIGMGSGDENYPPADRAWLFKAVKVPSLLALLEFEFLKLTRTSSHSSLVYTIAKR